MMGYQPRVGDRVAYYELGLREEMTIEVVAVHYIQGGGKTTLPSKVVEVLERAED